MTKFGPLDLLGAIGTGRGYGELLGQTVHLEVGAGLSVCVRDLATLIMVKEEVAHEKDRAVLARSATHSGAEVEVLRVSRAAPRWLREHM